MSTAKDIAKLHVFMCIEAAKSESNGDIETADRLRAQGNLRLVTMTSEELWELANLIYPKGSNVHDYYMHLHQVVRIRVDEAHEWLPQMFRKPFEWLSYN